MSIVSNNFAVSIKTPYDRTYSFKKIGKYNYVSLPNNSPYKIQLVNNRDQRCDATVTIDGVSVGTWRVPPYDSITIERPANINRRFLFFKQDSSLAKKTNLEHVSPFNGLISVTFKPELKMNYPYESDDYNQITGYIAEPTFYEKWNYGFDDSPGKTNIDFSAPVYRNSGADVSTQMDMTLNTTDDVYKPSNTNYIAGATMLGAGTDQQFNTANKLLKYDGSQTTTISLRLIVALPKAPKTSLVSAEKRYMPLPPKIDNGSHYIPVGNLTDRYYNADQVLIEKPYYSSVYN